MCGLEILIIWEYRGGIRKGGYRLTYHQQRLLRLILIDSCIVLTGVFLSWILVGHFSYMAILPYIMSSIAILLGHHLFAVIFNLYKKVWEYASTGELLIILKIVFYTGIVGAIAQYTSLQLLHVRFLIVTMVLHVLLIGGSRFVWRLYRDSIMNKEMNKLRTLIIGAGAAGTMVARQLIHNSESELLPVAFIDDEDRKSTRLNSSHVAISYAVFSLKNKRLKTQ